jgi:hypothetical protein
MHSRNMLMPVVLRCFVQELACFQRRPLLGQIA